ncbi:hypothetical protein [Wolbachia endosymbiont (group A) of Agelastica alni]
MRVTSASRVSSQCLYDVIPVLLFVIPVLDTGISFYFMMMSCK